MPTKSPAHEYCTTPWPPPFGLDGLTVAEASLMTEEQLQHLKATEKAQLAGRFHEQPERQGKGGYRTVMGFTAPEKKETGLGVRLTGL